ncbi:hypothetical protein ACFQ6O_29885 [Streptomyces sp. NPDC056441]|uniref:hypothetical protein n=1 Tax=Streptomyces sp. NPDC056441 TaxID=3345817 RepID=UPI0036B509AC
MELSAPAGLEFLAREVARRLGAHHVVHDGGVGRVRIVYADGRGMELTHNRSWTRITVTAVLPGHALVHGSEVRPSSPAPCTRAQRRRVI